MSPREKADRCKAFGYPVIENIERSPSIVIQHPSGQPVRIQYGVFAATPLAKLLSRIDRIVKAST